jgi:hypothetical protein
MPAAGPDMEHAPDRRKSSDDRAGTDRIHIFSNAFEYHDIITGVLIPSRKAYDGVLLPEINLVIPG